MNSFDVVLVNQVRLGTSVLEPGRVFNIPNDVDRALAALQAGGLVAPMSSYLRKLIDIIDSARRRGEDAKQFEGMLIANQAFGFCTGAIDAILWSLTAGEGGPPFGGTGDWNDVIAFLMFGGPPRQIIVDSWTESGMSELHIAAGGWSMNEARFVARWVGIAPNSVVVIDDGTIITDCAGLAGGVRLIGRASHNSAIYPSEAFEILDGSELRNESSAPMLNASGGTQLILRNNSKLTMAVGSGPIASLVDGQSIEVHCTGNSSLCDGWLVGSAGSTLRLYVGDGSFVLPSLPDFAGTLELHVDYGCVLKGTGTPAGVIATSPGVLYLDQAGGAGATLYVKETGTDTSGWVAK